MSTTPVRCPNCNSKLTRYLDLSKIPEKVFRYRCSLCGTTLERIQDTTPKRPEFGKRVRK